MSTAVLFILTLHSIAAVASAIVAIRERYGFSQALQWGGLGFITGILGLITRGRMDRRHMQYMQVVQDAILNFGLEVLAFFGLPYFLH